MVRFPFLEDIGVRVAAISTRDEGDCGYNTEDRTGRERLFAGCGVDPESVVGVGQVHGDEILVADDGHGGQGTWTAPNVAADGIVTNVPGITISISVADCVPVYLFALDVGAIGLLHAGRAGTLLGIAAKGVRLLSERYGASRGSIWAVVGPSICGGCYEVSPEMAEHFRAAGLIARERHIDLWASNRVQLERVGVPAEQIHVAGMCTAEEGELFSFRRDATAARNLALLVVG